jgi:hypothetical protein
VSVKVILVNVRELESRLREFEAEFGMTSSEFVESYSNGELPEDEGRFLTWVLTYDAWQLASNLHL